MSVQDELQAMGFDQAVINQALENVGPEGTIDQAIDCISHIQEQSGEAKDSNDNVAALVCNECSKRFASTAMAQYHATKTGHQDFSQSDEPIPTLTEEEKAAKLEELRQKLAEKRRLDEEERERKNRALEIQRRKSGAAAQEARQQLKEKEAAKLAERMKQEKLEERQRLLLIRQQMEAEKKERQREQQQQATASDNLSKTQVASVPAVNVQPGSSVRIQIRIAGISQPLKFVQKPDDPLQIIIDQLKDQGHTGSRLVIPHPRLELDLTDPSVLSETLATLGLCPSASLMLEL